MFLDAPLAETPHQFWSQKFFLDKLHPKPKLYTQFDVAMVTATSKYKGSRICLLMSQPSSPLILALKVVFGKLLAISS